MAEIRMEHRVWPGCLFKTNIRGIPELLSNSKNWSKSRTLSNTELVWKHQKTLGISSQLIFVATTLWILYNLLYTAKNRNSLFSLQTILHHYSSQKVVSWAKMLITVKKTILVIFLKRVQIAWTFWIPKLRTISSGTFLKVR